ncbi:Scr1 family TA system antitoxin-like transcriptional regulator, partial [Streptomyces seoulensis]|uniref:Scr1 family TA system antitoxin-like transcriptional regulator n=1 Tax=Streptomyces seoulensis TaxID=73044 RepID=UPI0022787205
MRLFGLGIIPGLLQTPEYPAPIPTGAVKRGEIREQRVEEPRTLLAGRRPALEPPPAPLFFVFLDESSLKRIVGGPFLWGTVFRKPLKKTGLGTVWPFR